MGGVTPDHATALRQIEAIVKVLEHPGLGAAPIQEAADLAWTRPEAVTDLATAVIKRCPIGRTFLDAASSYIPEGHWDRLVGADSGFEWTSGRLRLIL